MSHEDPKHQPPDAQGELSFDLDATEEELLEEFGLLMAAEYNYMTAEPTMSIKLLGDHKLELQVGLRDELKGTLQPGDIAQRPDVQARHERLKGE
jgi:hypothetical protein